jgi:hypothetical protein
LDRRLQQFVVDSKVEALTTSTDRWEASASESERKPALAYLVWFRDTDKIKTSVSFWMRAFVSVTESQRFYLRCELRDAHGRLVCELAREASIEDFVVVNRDTFVDESDWRVRWHAARLDRDAPWMLESVLSIEVRDADHRALPPRLLHLGVDWFGATGIASLHSDIQGYEDSHSLEITEISVNETNYEHNSIIFINGLKANFNRAITLVATNVKNETIKAAVQIDWTPYTVQQIALAEVFPELVRFGAGRPVLIQGTLALDGVWQRPYVLTESARFGVYHAGNRFAWNDTPALKHRFDGRESNPMFVRIDDEMTTVAHLMNTHGSVVQDVWIDCEVFDLAGQRVFARERFACVARNRLTSIDLAEVLSSLPRPLFGHVSFRFTTTEAEIYPGRLQALMEYGTARSVARIMAWSDMWNWSLRRKHAKALLSTSHYRAWIGNGKRTWVALTNTSVDANYSECAKLILKLRCSDREYVVERTIEPNATLYAQIETLFALPFGVDKSRPALFVCESEHDIAGVQFTLNDGNGAWCAEHLLPVSTITEDGVWWPIGG